MSLTPRPGTPVGNGEGAGVTIGIRARLKSLNTNLRDQRFRHCSLFPYGSVGLVVVNIEIEIEQLRGFAEIGTTKNPRTAV